MNRDSRISQGLSALNQPGQCSDIHSVLCGCYRRPSPHPCCVAGSSDQRGRPRTLAKFNPGGRGDGARCLSLFSPRYMAALGTADPHHTCSRFDIICPARASREKLSLLQCGPRKPYGAHHRGRHPNFGIPIPHG